MKVNELIRRLQESDPSGELEACVGNIDIHFVAREPAYHDGCLQVLRRDPARFNRCYDIIGAALVSTGQKIQIYTHSIRDAIWENPDLPIEGADDRVEDWRRKV